MARMFLILTLTIEALLGPSRCCCALDHVATAAVQDDGEASCCMCKDQADSLPRNTKDSSPKRPCPCQERPAKDVAVLSLSLDAAGQELSMNSQQVCLHGEPCSPSQTPGPRPEIAIVPFLVAQDLIRAHHLMRC
jgi:hypothetical protein